MRIFAALLVAVLCAGTASASPERKLDMLAFFGGKTHAENVLKIVLKRPVKLVVDSVGGRGDRGDFVLIDTVREEGKPVRTRKWVMKQVSPNRYTGSLSDAVGPVEVVVSGDTATIRYLMKGGLKIEQVMRMQRDGRTLSNSVTARRLGLKFARIEGTIRKLD
jgi:hypothetical protein